MRASWEGNRNSYRQSRWKILWVRKKERRASGSFGILGSSNGKEGPRTRIGKFHAIASPSHEVRISGGCCMDAPFFTSQTPAIAIASDHNGPGPPRWTCRSSTRRQFQRNRPSRRLLPAFIQEKGREKNREKKTRTHRETPPAIAGTR